MRQVPKTTPRPTIDQILAGLPEDLVASSGDGYLAVHADEYSWLPDKSVDLILTDPPFNIAQETNFHTWDQNSIHSYKFDEDKGWDTYSAEDFIATMHNWAVGFQRVLRPGGSFAVFCADKYLSHLIDALTAAGLAPRRTISWRKPNAVPINRKAMPMSACEYIVVGVRPGKPGVFNVDLGLDDLSALCEIEPTIVADKVATIIAAEVRRQVAGLTTTGTDRPTDVLTAIDAAIANAAKDVRKRVGSMYVDDSYFRACIPNYVENNSKTGKRIHPTEKPVAVLRYLAALMSRPGDLVLDCFAGSGSTGEAALLLGREVVLVERDDEFFPNLGPRLEGVLAEKAELDLLAALAAEEAAGDEETADGEGVEG